jgi:hypothetical protein
LTKLVAKRGELWSQKYVTKRAVIVIRLNMCVKRMTDTSVESKQNNQDCETNRRAIKNIIICNNSEINKFTLQTKNPAS